MGFILPDIPMEDRLLLAARRGDQAAIGEIYQSYFTPIYQFIWFQVEDEQLAQDIAAEVFFKFVDTVQGKNGPRQSLRGWLFQVARNKVNDYHSSIKRRPTSELDESLAIPAEGDLEVEFMDQIEQERVRHALRMLAQDQREVLLLRYVESLSLQETADIMGRQVAAIKSLQFRAMSTLRHILGEKVGEDSDG